MALMLNASETTPEHLLVQAQLLSILPGRLKALDSGLPGVQQAGAFTRAVADLPIDVVRVVWQQLRPADSGCLLRWGAAPGPAEGSGHRVGHLR